MTPGIIVITLVSAAYCGMALREFVLLKRTLDQIEKKVLEGDIDAKRALILVDQVQSAISIHGLYVAFALLSLFWPALWWQSWRNKRRKALAVKTL